MITVRLAELRERKGLSQRQLAELLGVTSGAVGNWEAGTRIPRLPMLRKIARVLGVSIDEIEFGPPVDSKSEHEEVAV